MSLDLPRQLAARNEQAQLHVDREGVLGEIGARQEHPVSISHGTFDVQDTDLAIIVFGPILLRPVIYGTSRGNIVPQGHDTVVFSLSLNSIWRLDDQSNVDAPAGSGD